MYSVERNERMVTAIYSLDKVNGAEIMLSGWIICGVIYLLLCLLIRPVILLTAGTFVMIQNKEK